MNKHSLPEIGLYHISYADKLLRTSSNDTGDLLVSHYPLFGGDVETLPWWVQFVSSGEPKTMDGWEKFVRIAGMKTEETKEVPVDSALTKETGDFINRRCININTQNQVNKWQSTRLETFHVEKDEHLSSRSAAEVKIPRRAVLYCDKLQLDW